MTQIEYKIENKTLDNLSPIVPLILNMEFVTSISKAKANALMILGAVTVEPFFIVITVVPF